jgi:hypothetical protein
MKNSRYIISKLKKLLPKTSTIKKSKHSPAGSLVFLVSPYKEIFDGKQLMGALTFTDIEMEKMHPCVVDVMIESRAKVLMKEAEKMRDNMLALHKE